MVVTILGILAALVLPTFSDHATNARESAAKSNLMTIRSQIELYKLQHNGIPPGYVNGAAASVDVLKLQFVGTSAVNGAASSGTVPSAPFLYGPYLKKIPQKKGKVLRVIINPTTKPDRVITVFFDRRVQL